MVQVSQYFSSETPMRIALLIPTLCLLGIVMILAVTAPATGYEVSVYHEYPFVLWILFGLLYLFPFLYLLFTANKTFGLVFRKWHINYILTVALCGTLLLLSLPLIRGYYCYTGGDILSHMGTILDILNGSASLIINHYPASMVEVSMLHLMSGVAVNQIILCAIQWTVLFFVLGMFCLARRFCTNYTQVVVITALSTIPILGNFLTQEIFVPSTIGWALLPMLFFCAYCVVTKARGYNIFLIAACVLSVGLWYIHSEAIVFGGITLILALFFILFWPFQREILRELNYRGLIVIITVLVLGAIFLVTFTDMFSGQVMNYFNIFFGDIAEVSTASPLGKFDNNLSLFRNIVVMFLIYGQVIIVSICATLLLFYRIIKERGCISLNLSLPFLVVLFSCVGVVCIWYIFVGNSVGQFVYRVFKYQLIFCIFAIGCLTSVTEIGDKKQAIKKTISIIVILLLVCFPLINVYHSPYLNNSVSLQATQSDLSGMKVFFSVQDSGKGITETGARFHASRYGTAIYGSSLSAENVRGVPSEEFRIPSGFDVNSVLPSSDYFKKDTYLLYYPPNIEFDLINLFSEIKGLSPLSSLHFAFDNTVDKVIDLGQDFSVHLIRV